jgi:hypothetical protein
MSGWIVADALGATKSAAAITPAETRRFTFDLLSVICSATTSTAKGRDLKPCGRRSFGGDGWRLVGSNWIDAATAAAESPPSSGYRAT